MNYAINIKIVSGKGKTGKDYYALKITHHYDSGKDYTEMVFLKRKEFENLTSIYKDNIIIGE